MSIPRSTARCPTAPTATFMVGRTCGRFRSEGRGIAKIWGLLKRKRLIERGWPSSTLLMTIVTTSSGEGHAVLTAVTDQGDYVLDTRTWRSACGPRPGMNSIPGRPKTIRSVGCGSSLDSFDGRRARELAPTDRRLVNAVRIEARPDPPRSGPRRRRSEPGLLAALATAIACATAIVALSPPGPRYCRDRLRRCPGRRCRRPNRPCRRFRSSRCCHVLAGTADPALTTDPAIACAVAVSVRAGIPAALACVDSARAADSALAANT